MDNSDLLDDTIKIVVSIVNQKEKTQTKVNQEVKVKKAILKSLTKAQATRVWITK